MFDLDESIITIFRQYYPLVDHRLLDPLELASMIDTMFDSERLKYGDSDDDCEDNSIVDKNYSLASEHIPEMIDSGDLVSIKGRLNGLHVNILFDSGCQTTSTYSSIVKAANIIDLLDKSAHTYCMGINGRIKTLGMIWYINLDLETGISSGDYISVPTKLSILDDIIDGSELDSELESETKIQLLIGTDFMKAHDVIINFKKRLITINGSEIMY